MVKVSVFKDGFNALGHANHAPHGKDIVCSAISALTQTTAKALKTYCIVHVDVDSSGLYVYVGKPNKKSALIIGTMLIGLREIAEQYPMNLSIKEEWEK